MPKMKSQYLSALALCVLLGALTTGSLSQAQSSCPASFIEHAKWDGTDIYQGMPVNQSMCTQMPSMACCKEFFEHQAATRPQRRHISPQDLAAFPSQAPGLKDYQALGYCAGDLRTETETVVHPDGSKTNRSVNVRRYDLIAENSKGYFQLRSDKCPALNHASPSEKRRAISGPPLLFQNGEVAEIILHNNSSEPTSIHWHGLELENGSDGVPGVTQKPIAPNTTYRYRIPLKQDGTYWYHPHTLQEQEARGAFLIFPKSNDPVFNNRKVDTRYHQDRLILLTDYLNLSPQKILARLQQDSGNVQLDGKLYNDLWTAYKTDDGRGFRRAFENLKSMGMFSMDKADIYYSDFFMNDERCLNCSEQTPKARQQSELEFGRLRAGERVRLRIINGSTSSYFYLDYANNKQLPENQKLPMMIVAKDGKNVKPVEVDQLYLGMGECFDVIVEIPEAHRGYELRLKSIDDEFNKRLSRVILGENRGNGNVQTARDVPVTTFGEIPTESYTQVNYDMLKSLNPAPIDPQIPIRYYDFELVGNMENYYWQIKGINGTRLDPRSPMPMLEIPNNTRIHITIHNSMKMGMMNHPMHLHGQFFRLIKKGENLNDVADRAFMHTATVFPGGDLELEFYSGAKGTWMFHCHNLYHMANSMMMALVTRSENSGHDGHSAMPGMQNFSNDEVSSIQGDFGIGTNSVNASATYVKPNGNSNLNKVDVFFDRTENSKALTIKAGGTYSYCQEPDKCVTLNIDIHQLIKDGKTVESSIAPGVGYMFKPFNSKLLTANVSVYTNQALKTSLSSEIGIAPNTSLEGEIGCEGKFCKDFEVGFAVAVRPKLNIKLIPIRCSYSKETGAYCGAEVHFLTDPTPLR